MSRVEELLETINQLSNDEHRELAERIQEQEEARWDAQMDADAAAGKLDFLRDQALAARAKGEVTPLP